VKVRVLFHSYFRELTGHNELDREVSGGTTLGDLVKELQEEFPKLKPMERSTLLAVDVEYQSGDYLLRDGDEISLFPPVQGG
jgi:molybdopterin converting factor small subunit